MALEALRDSPSTEIALLTGRSLAALAELGVNTDGWYVAGSHGAELSHVEAMRLTEDERDRLDWLGHRVELVFWDEPGVRVERKPFGLAVHARQVGDADQAEEVLAAASVLGGNAGMHEREGKLVREFSTRKTTKADALEHIRKAFPGTPVLFLGDDTTDEDVFRVLGLDDLGVKVGPGETHAQVRIESPAAVSTLLALLAELRTGIVIGSV